MLTDSALRVLHNSAKPKASDVGQTLFERFSRFKKAVLTKDSFTHSMPNSAKESAQNRVKNETVDPTTLPHSESEATKVKDVSSEPEVVTPNESENVVSAPLKTEPESPKPAFHRRSVDIDNLDLPGGFPQDTVEHPLQEQIHLDSQSRRSSMSSENSVLSDLDSQADDASSVFHDAVEYISPSILKEESSLNPAKIAEDTFFAPREMAIENPSPEPLQIRKPDEGALAEEKTKVSDNALSRKDVSEEALNKAMHELSLENPTLLPLEIRTFAARQLADEAAKVSELPVSDKDVSKDALNKAMQELAIENPTPLPLKIRTSTERQLAEEEAKASHYPLSGQDISDKAMDQAMQDVKGAYSVLGRDTSHHPREEASLSLEMPNQVLVILNRSSSHSDATTLVRVENRSSVENLKHISPDTQLERYIPTHRIPPPGSSLFWKGYTDPFIQADHDAVARYNDLYGTDYVSIKDVPTERPEFIAALSRYNDKFKTNHQFFREIPEEHLSDILHTEEYVGFFSEKTKVVSKPVITKRVEDYVQELAKHKKPELVQIPPEQRRDIWTGLCHQNLKKATKLARKSLNSGSMIEPQAELYNTFSRVTSDERHIMNTIHLPRLRQKTTSVAQKQYVKHASIEDLVPTPGMQQALEDAKKAGGKSIDENASYVRKAAHPQHVIVPRVQITSIWRRLESPAQLKAYPQASISPLTSWDKVVGWFKKYDPSKQWESDLPLIKVVLDEEKNQGVERLTFSELQAKVLEKKKMASENNQGVVSENTSFTQAIRQRLTWLQGKLLGTN